MPSRIIYWFRNDLRLDDNEAFWKAAHDADTLLPVYVFDPRRYRMRSPGFRKTGLRRAIYCLRAVQNLRERLQAIGGDLIIRTGEPERIINELANLHNITEVRTSKEITLEETNIEASLSKNLKAINVDISLTWMDTLIHPHDLPFYISRLPESFPLFFSKIKTVTVRNPVQGGTQIPMLEGESGSDLPELTQLGFETEEIAGTSQDEAVPLTENGVKSVIRNGNASNQQILDWLSDGLVSPRAVWHLIKGSVLQDPLYRLLMWRDYLQFSALRYGSRLFKPSGLTHQIDRSWEYSEEKFRQWSEGRTTNPDVNRIMKKLQATGRLTMEETWTAARFLIEELGVNWTWGAAWFESCLISYEVTLNWGIWNYFAGVGQGLSVEPEL